MSAQIGSYSIGYILACHVQIDADPVPDPAYYFDGSGSGFYLMRMRIQVTTIMRIQADPEPQHCFLQDFQLVEVVGSS